VSVYDISGHRVRTLAVEREFPAGGQNLFWDGTNDVGAHSSTGVYYVRVTAAGTSVAKRVAILR
jgi:flagellar hook assembly protein FlgD